ncbi:hypothetical protein Tco_0296511 [Tanacetum coccineum]
MVDVPIHRENLAIQRTSLIDIVISMVTEKTTSTPTPPTTQAQVTNVSKSDSSLKFEQRLLELEKKVEAMPKRAWTKKDQKQTDEMDKRDRLQTAYVDNLTFSFCHATIEVQFRSLSCDHAYM